MRFTGTLNLASDDPRRAINEMIYTAEHAQDIKAAAGVKATGRKLEKPVYTFSLSWHPSEDPRQDQMLAAAESALKALKMDGHQVLMVAHNDTAHPHIHVIVNRVDPETGKAHGLNKDQLVLSKWAERYEREFGKTWCKERVANNAERGRQQADDGRRRFVKDRQGQQRDARPQYDRRAKAIQARIAARGAQTAARGAQQLNRDRAEWKIQQINALQDRHIAQRDALAKGYEQQRTNAEAVIEKTYGAARRADAERLAVLVERIEMGSHLSRFVDRLRGLDDQRTALELNLANIDQRSHEIRSPIVREEIRARKRLTERQRHEQLELERRLEQPTPQPASPALEQQQRLEPDRDRARGYGRDL